MCRPQNLVLAFDTKQINRHVKLMQLSYRSQIKLIMYKNGYLEVVVFFTLTKQQLPVSLLFLLKLKEHICTNYMPVWFLSGAEHFCHLTQLLRGCLSEGEKKAPTSFKMLEKVHSLKLRCPTTKGYRSTFNSSLTLMHS